MNKKILVIVALVMIVSATALAAPNDQPANGNWVDQMVQSCQNAMGWNGSSGSSNQGANGMMGSGMMNGQGHMMGNNGMMNGQGHMMGNSETN